MTNFREKTIGGYTVWEVDEIADQGIEHGFIGVTGDFSDGNLERESRLFCETFKISKLLLPNQVHGTTVTSVTAGELSTPSADGVIVPLFPPDSSERSQRVAIGIRTADCVPLIFFSDTHVVVVHAGWRGLSQRIITKALKLTAPPYIVVIGPSAGKMAYEVQDDVLSACLPFSKFESDPVTGKSLFDLRGTAIREILSGSQTVRMLYESEHCTITDPRFHSFRRQGAARGSNLCFVILSSRAIGVD